MKKFLKFLLVLIILALAVMAFIKFDGMELVRKFIDKDEATTLGEEIENTDTTEADTTEGEPYHEPEVPTGDTESAIPEETTSVPEETTADSAVEDNVIDIPELPTEETVAAFSEWLGLKFTPADNMKLATPDEIIAMLNDASEQLGIGDALAVWVDKIFAFEMMATENRTFANMMVLVDEKPSFKNLSPEKFIGTLKLTLGTITGGVIEFGDVSEATVAGQTYTRIELATAVGGETLEHVVYLRQVDERMAGIVMISVDEESERAFLECFEAQQ